MRANLTQARYGTVLRRATIAGGLVAGSVVVHHHLIKDRGVGAPQLRIHRPVVDALAGAFGEVCQVCMLYPVETWRVRCQAEGLGSLIVAKRLVSRYGLTYNLLKHLYAGFASAALFSCAVGAVHWLSFCAAKRAALRYMPQTSAGNSSDKEQATGAQQSSTSSQKEGCHQHHHAQFPAVSSSHHLQPPHLADEEAEPASQDDSSKSASANLFAAIIGALATALIESPVELFRHKAQAGLISGSVTHEMSRTVRKGGLGALWSGFLPFCLEAFPYDCSELGSYSQLRDWYEQVSKPGGRFHKFCSRYPDHAWDLAMGGAAGAVAVIVGMPFDCIKTHDTGIAGTSVAVQIAAFISTGHMLVQTRGPGALFVGAVPRLVQQIPSSTICWWAVQQAHNVLEPYIIPDATAAATDGSGNNKSNRQEKDHPGGSRKKRGHK